MAVTKAMKVDKSDEELLAEIKKICTNLWQAEREKYGLQEGERRAFFVGMLVASTTPSALPEEFKTLEGLLDWMERQMLIVSTEAGGGQ